MLLFVCLFSKEIQTAGWMGMKFGMEVVLGGGNVWGESTRCPHPLGTGCIKGSGVPLEPKQCILAKTL